MVLTVLYVPSLRDSRSDIYTPRALSLSHTLALSFSLSLYLSLSLSTSISLPLSLKLSMLQAVKRRIRPHFYQVPRLKNCFRSSRPGQREREREREKKK